MNNRWAIIESPGLCIELIDEFCVDSGVKTGKQGGPKNTSMDKVMSCSCAP